MRMERAEPVSIVKNGSLQPRAQMNDRMICVTLVVSKQSFIRRAYKLWVFDYLDFPGGGTGIREPGCMSF